MIEIIPSIDIIGGACVRLVRGDYSQITAYNSDPLILAKKYEDLGFHRLHLVDLDGAREGKVVNLKVLEKIAGNTKLIIDFGGGVKTREDLQMVFSAGATMVNLGSVAVLNQVVVLEWLNHYGSDRMILSADVKERLVAYNGWQKTSHLEIIDFIKDYYNKGIRKVSCTDIGKDGLLKGPGINLYKDLKYLFKEIFLIASWGISSINDVRLLEKAGIDAVIIGRALYEIRGFPEELARRFIE